MASSINSLLGSPVTTPSSTSAANTTGLGGTVPSEGVFLQLLVSQLKNQDPLNPTDSTTFVTQLAQFSQLEQVIGIKSDTDSLAASAAAAATAASTAASTASSSSTTQPGAPATTTSNPATTTTTTTN